MSAPSNDRYGKRTYFGILPEFWDQIDVGYPDAITEVYTYSTQEENGPNIVRGIIEITYVDDTKEDILQVVRTL